MANKRQKKKKQQNQPKEPQPTFNGDYKNVPSNLDNLGKQCYKFLLEQLEDSNLLDNLDTPLLEQTADTLSKLRQCDQILNDEGILLKQIDRYGNEVTKEHPTVKTKMQYMNQFKSLFPQLGMSPSSRATLASTQIEEGQTEDPLLEMLKG